MAALHPVIFFIGCSKASLINVLFGNQILIETIAFQKLCVFGICNGDDAEIDVLAVLIVEIDEVGFANRHDVDHGEPDGG